MHSDLAPALRGNLISACRHRQVVVDSSLQGSSPRR
jgi:hypothetical protein